MSKFETPIHGKPFLKWAGGKGQLLDKIASYLPNNISEIDTYIEPFVGGGAVLFWLISHYPSIKRVVINDLNTELVNLYLSIKLSVEELISELKVLDTDFKKFTSQEEKSEYYYSIRNEYNSRNLTSNERSIRLAALFVFLNKTCFNGLYRVNTKNLFNVPFGKYVNPKIFDEENLRNDSELLQRVDILNGDYAETIQYASTKALYYLDPPYKPISSTSSFNSYSVMSFNDEQQIRLKEFCDSINERGAKFILSNSDPKNVDAENNFFDDLYSTYTIHRVSAKRNINSKGDKRGKINELLITNY